MKSMTPEEERFERIERNMEFIAASLARLSASSETHASIIAGHASIIAEHASMVAKHAGMFEENDRLIARNSEQIGELMNLTLRIGHVVEEQGRQTDEQLKALTQSQKRTDDRLNILINVVERYFSDGRHPN